MAECVNPNGTPITVEWCTHPDHFDQDGTHTGTEGCRIKSHTINPGALLSYGDAANTPTIEDAVTAASLAPIT